MDAGHDDNQADKAYDVLEKHHQSNKSSKALLFTPAESGEDGTESDIKDLDSETANPDVFDSELEDASEGRTRAKWNSRKSHKLAISTQLHFTPYNGPKFRSSRRQNGSSS